MWASPPCAPSSSAPSTSTPTTKLVRDHDDDDDDGDDDDDDGDDIYIMMKCVSQKMITSYQLELSARGAKPDSW